MELDVNVVLNKLSMRLAQLEIELAKKDALIEKLLTEKNEQAPTK